MSTWYEADDDDIDLNTKLKTVDISLEPDYSGNIYVTITWDQLDLIYAAKELALRLLQEKRNGK